MSLNKLLIINMLFLAIPVGNLFGQIVDKTFFNNATINQLHYVNNLNVIDDPISISTMGGSSPPKILKPYLSKIENKMKLKLLDNGISVGDGGEYTEDGKMYYSYPRLLISNEFIVTKKNIIFNIVIFLTVNVEARNPLYKKKYADFPLVTLWRKAYFGYLDKNNKKEIISYYNTLLNRFIEDFKSSR